MVVQKGVQYVSLFKCSWQSDARHVSELKGKTWISFKIILCNQLALRETIKDPLRNSLQTVNEFKKIN